jgi:GNAT superfamily N-acetyltransferase
VSASSTTSFRLRTSTTSEIPERVRLLAENPTVYGPLPPGFERVEEEGYCVMFGPMPQMNMVQRLRLGPEEVEPALKEVRGLARDRGRTQVTWWLGDSATPADLEERLRGLGLERAAMPIHEPVYGALALVHPPAGSSQGVVARQIKSYEEFLTSADIAHVAFGQTEQQRESFHNAAPMLYELGRQGVAATYLAFLDGEPVACATAVFADAAVMLVGGATLPEARGRGCYRALVRARWDDAVRRGTPTLVVQAGEMSRPVLERLGFQLVSQLRVLLDELE